MSNSPKRHRVELQGTDVKSFGHEKYPFVDHDQWMQNFSAPSGSLFVSASDDRNESSAAGQQIFTARPVPVWLTLATEGGVSDQCRSAQYSAVAHSPTVSADSQGEESLMMMYSSWEYVNNYIAFRSSLPNNILHPFSESGLYFEALVADVISNSVRRDPSLYKSIWPVSMLGITMVEPHGVADLAVARTRSGSNEQARLPWTWELNNRQEIVTRIIEGLNATRNDLLVPFQGLILSPWVAGVLFRLTQLFFKVTVVRSQVSPRWDDTCFIFCQGKRSSSKLVDKAHKLLTRLISNTYPASNCKWGYSVPPVCFSDPVWIGWLRNINTQLIGAVRPSAPFQSETYESIYKLSSRLRLKKYLFPNEPNTLIGFYFGSFNPVHENHIALAEYAHKQLGLSRIVFVPNSDEHEAKKEELLPMDHRVSMLEARASSIDWMSVLKPPGSTKRWESKAEIAEDACSSLMQDAPSIGVPALLLGQDSWNKAVLGSSRDKITRHFIGISKLVNAKFFIFPRNEGQDIGQPVLPAPKPIRDNVAVVDGYRDPITDLSSSRIRQTLRMNFLECPEGLHVRVYEYVRANNLYASST